MTVDYTQPIRFKCDGRPQPENVQVTPLLGGVAVISWDKSAPWAGGKCLFDSEGKWLGDLENPGSRAGRLLLVENMPDKKTVYIRLSAHYQNSKGEGLTLHREVPLGQAVAVLKVTLVDGIVVESEVVRANITPITKLYFGNPQDDRVREDERREPEEL